MNKIFVQKLRIATSEADDLLSSCDASDLLDGLEVARDYMFEAANEIEHLESRLAQAERERDAAVDDLLYLARNEEGNWACDLCNASGPLQCTLCVNNMHNGFKWRGVCAENTKDGNT